MSARMNGADRAHRKTSGRFWWRPLAVGLTLGALVSCQTPATVEPPPTLPGWTAGLVTVAAIRSGRASFHPPNRTWRPLRAGSVFYEGAVVQTDNRAACDLAMHANGVVVRAGPGTLLIFDHLRYRTNDAGDLIDTSLRLEAGRVSGHVQPLQSNSIYELKAAGFTYRTHGGQYSLQADGALSVFQGLVEVSNLRGTDIVEAGQLFVPARLTAPIQPRPQTPRPPPARPSRKPPSQP